MSSHVVIFGKVAMISLSKMLSLQATQDALFVALRAIQELQSRVILSRFQILLDHLE